MPVLRRVLCALTLGAVLVAAPLRATAQQMVASTEPLPTAETIMARVAANQDKSESARAHYVYVQHARVVSRKGKTILCEETTDSRVTPSSTGSLARLLTLQGRLLRKHSYVSYTTPLAAYAPTGKEGQAMVASDQDSLSINIGDDDRALVESMRVSLTNDGSRDGVGGRLFPLTSRSQADYQFHLAGRERMNGHDVFHVDFRPKDKNDFSWKGDAYIDDVAYEPVVVTTTMSRNMPFVVRTMLGTKVPGLGFTVAYAPQPDGVWFPVTFGTEFKVQILFLFSREILIDAENREFEKTHVSSRIVGDPVRQ